MANLKKQLSGLGLLITTLGTLMMANLAIGSDLPIYEIDLGQEATPLFDPVPNPAVDAVIDVSETAQIITIPTPGTEWLGFWDAGQVAVQGEERLEIQARTSQNITPEAAAQLFSLSWYGGEYLSLSPDDIVVTQDNEIGGCLITIEHNFKPEDAGKILSGFWLRFSNPGPDEASVTIESFRVFDLSDQPGDSARAVEGDVDQILQTPPVHDAKVALSNGVMTIFLDGQPIPGTGWAHIALHNISDEQVEEMVSNSGGSLIRVVSALGDSVTKIHPDSWDGRDGFNFDYLDTQMGRVMKYNPDAKVILMVALDGAKGWTRMHPEAAEDPKMGIPDYLSPEWRQTSRDVIRRFIAHVQSSSYGGSVIGYQLYNGMSMDCNFALPRGNERMLGDFRKFLGEKYDSDAELASAWGLSFATLENAGQVSLNSFWEMMRNPVTLLIEPRQQQAVLDTLEFRGMEYAQVIMNFAKDIKEATHGRALVGARTGDFIGNNGWIWADSLGDCQLGNVMRLSQCEDFDFYDIQEPYPGREIGSGNGVPVLPVRGLAEDDKLVFIQNDIRTHLSAPNAGYGRTKDLEATIAIQRRVFVNALIYGAVPYLWEQDYRYDDPAMLADYRRQEEIFEKALKVDRSSGAQIAFVFDRDYRRYLGFDPFHSEPSRGFSLLDYIKFPWLRMGAPFDMVFLDQIEELPPYKVYVFVHNFAVSPEQREMIHRVTTQEGRVAIYMWADGIIDRDGAFDGLAVSDLTGMNVEMSRIERSWKLYPTEWFREQVSGLSAEESLGTLSAYDPSELDAGDNVYAPSFEIKDPSVQAIAKRDDGSVGIAIKKSPDHAVIYTASATVTAPILRYALSVAGGFNYTDSDAQTMIDNSFIGFHTYQDETIALRLPKATPLYDVFNDKEYSAANTIKIPVEKDKTYLFYRGGKREWDAIGAPALTANLNNSH